MRLLMTTDAVGGVWTCSLDLARGLIERGTDVVLATMGPPPSDDQRAEARAAGLAKLYESGFALEWTPDPWNDVDAAADWLRELAAAEAVDVLHSCAFSHGTLDAGCPVVVTAHSCVVSWWRAVKGGEPPPEWDEYRHRVATGLHAADAVVAPTSAMLASLARDHGFASGIVIANGSLAPEADGGAAGAREPLILAAGRLWDPAKGLEVLDGAAAGLDWPVAAAGEGGTPHNIHRLGRLGRDQLAALRTRASIFAAPARYEPFGLAILEAARAGCALVLSDIPSLRELWAEAAVFVPANDPRALRAALAELCSDPEQLGRLRRAARIRSRRYTVERMASAYGQLYERLAARRREGVAA